VVDPDARFYPSVRGTRMIVGARTRIDAFAIFRAVGGMGDIVIGEDCFIGPSCVLYSGNGIRLGNDVLLAPQVSIMPTNHAFGRRDVPIRRQRFMPSKGGVVVEDDVWIGTQAVLLDGVYVERGAIIGAGSVVRGRVPAYTIWAGVPARQIGERP
jgi:acetyltransferase-like isoleucine patch superfamily enzyme